MVLPSFTPSFTPTNTPTPTDTPRPTLTLTATATAPEISLSLDTALTEAFYNPVSWVRTPHFGTEVVAVSTAERLSDDPEVVAVVAIVRTIAQAHFPIDGIPYEMGIPMWKENGQPIQTLEEITIVVRYHLSGIRMWEVSPVAEVRLARTLCDLKEAGFQSTVNVLLNYGNDGGNSFCFSPEQLSQLDCSNPDTIEVREIANTQCSWR